MIHIIFSGGSSDVLMDRKDFSAEIEIKLPENIKLPSVYICNCDETAAQLIALLKSRGIKVPEDVSVTGFDNYVANPKDSVPLTTVSIKRMCKYRCCRKRCCTRSRKAFWRRICLCSATLWSRYKLSCLLGNLERKS